VTEERLRDLMAERAPWFSAEIAEVVWSTAIRFERRLARRFGVGRVWLAGDAAHIALPIGIQSMNVGFRESEELTWRISEILRKGGSMELLEAFNDQSRAEWQSLMGLAGRRAEAAEGGSWIARNASRIVQCIPASGEDLNALLKQIGL